MGDQVQYDLEFVPTNAMWQELCKRFDCAVLLAEARRTEDGQEYIRWFHGPYTHIAGMCDHARAIALEHLIERENEEC